LTIKKLKARKFKFFSNVRLSIQASNMINKPIPKRTGGQQSKVTEGITASPAI